MDLPLPVEAVSGMRALRDACLALTAAAALLPGSAFMERLL
jgi:hypothetical protein